MAMDFPVSPTVGQLYPPTVIAGVPQYAWDGEKWGSPFMAADALHVLKAGDTMTGPLILPSVMSTNAYAAAHRNYSETSLRQVVFNSGAAYTLSLTDVGKLIWLYHTAAVTLTVPLNSAVAFPTGTQIDLTQGGAQVTVAAAGGITIYSEDNKRKLLKAYSCATLVKINMPDVWVLTGSLAA